MTRLLMLEELRRLPDGAGGYAENWAPLGQVWGAVKAGTGRELSGVEVTGPQVSYRITVRAMTERPRAGQRFRAGERLFRILAVADAEPGWLTCFAAEGAA